ncbi:MAG TPA: matrixin family metalloprotease [Verrucomicrobiae bacterium]|nr:matrixin family metalloprotease [Verrucomicrobiae bacterium]
MNEQIHVCIDKGKATEVYDKKTEGPIAVDTRFMWPSQGKTLKIKFLEGDSYIINKVKEKFSLWSPYAKNIKFEYVTEGNADVRIDFKQDESSWSYIGQEILDYPQDQPTMHFGWFNKDTKDEEFERTAVHEMGHTLGFIHEQSQPLANIDWDVDAVYAYFKKYDNWDRDTTYHNVMERYSKQITQYTEYDPTSIMQYFIPKELLKSGNAISGGNKLSELDKAFAKQLYGQA